jgi:hypothetical protein
MAPAGVQFLVERYGFHNSGGEGPELGAWSLAVGETHGECGAEPVDYCRVECSSGPLVP